MNNKYKEIKDPQITEMTILVLTAILLNQNQINKLSLFKDKEILFEFLIKFKESVSEYVFMSSNDGKKKSELK